MSEPLAFESLSVIRFETFELVISDVSVLTIASFNSIVMAESLPTPVSPFEGLKVIVGAVASTVVKFSVVASFIPI